MTDLHENNENEMTAVQTEPVQNGSENKAELDSADNLMKEKDIKTVSRKQTAMMIWTEKEK